MLLEPVPSVLQAVFVELRLAHGDITELARCFKVYRTNTTLHFEAIMKSAREPEAK